jgi:hypothetical protein
MRYAGRVSHSPRVLASQRFLRCHDLVTTHRRVGNPSRYFLRMSRSFRDIAFTPAAQAVRVERRPGGVPGARSDEAQITEWEAELAKVNA